MKKLIASFLITALCLTGTVFFKPVQVEADAKTTVQQLRDELAKLQEQQKKIESQKKEIGDEIDTLLSKKSVIDEQLSVTNGRISAYEDLISNLNKQIAVKQAQIEELAKERDGYIAKIRQRARESFERGEASSLSILVGAEDINDVMTKIEMMKQVSEYDNSLIAKIEEDAAAVEQMKKEIDDEKAEQQARLAELEAVKAEQRSQMGELQGTIDSLESNQDSLERQQAAYEEKEAVLDKKIAAAAAAEAAANGNGGSAAVHPGTGTLCWPVPASGTISSGYGYRSFTNSFHYAIDISAPRGTAVVAADSGTVVSAGWVTTGGGNKIVVNHGNGMFTYYNHLSGFAVSAGDAVKKGQTIGYVGATGFATGNHLDFRVLVNGSYQNPLNYVRY